MSCDSGWTKKLFYRLLNDLPNRTGEAISRDAMCWSEIEMLSFKLVVRKICQLQSDKNATKQTSNRGREIWEAIFSRSDQLMAITTREGKREKHRVWNSTLQTYTAVFVFCIYCTVHTVYTEHAHWNKAIWHCKHLSTVYPSHASLIIKWVFYLIKLLNKPLRHLYY